MADGLVSGGMFLLCGPFCGVSTILAGESLASEDDSDDSTISGASGAARTQVFVFIRVSGSESFEVGAVILVEVSTIRLSSSSMDDADDSEESLSSNQCFDSLLVVSLDTLLEGGLADDVFASTDCTVSLAS